MIAMILFALLISTLGFLAGFYLAVWPVVILSVLGIGWCVFWWGEADRAPGGTSGGIGAAMVSFVGVLFVIQMWVGVGVAHLSEHGSLSGEVIKQFLFR